MDNVKERYFEWLCESVGSEKRKKSISYRDLLRYLHNRKFIWSVLGDSNRANDGINLRWEYAYETDQTDIFEQISKELEGPCSVLEMLVALARRCEYTIMDDPKYGDRTAQWFWRMMINLGLGAITDERFDKGYVEEVITRFLNRKYDADGTGGLFTIKYCDTDLRKVQIWDQMCWYLNTLI